MRLEDVIRLAMEAAGIPVEEIVEEKNNGAMEEKMAEENLFDLESILGDMPTTNSFLEDVRSIWKICFQFDSNFNSLCFRRTSLPSFSSSFGTATCSKNRLLPCFCFSKLHLFKIARSLCTFSKIASFSKVAKVGKCRFENAIDLRRRAGDAPTRPINIRCKLEFGYGSLLHPYLTCNFYFRSTECLYHRLLPRFVKHLDWFEEDIDAVRKKILELRMEST